MISLLLCVWSVDMYGMCCVQCRISVDRRTQLPHLLPAVYCCRCCRISRLPSRYENRGNVCSIVSACLSYKYLSGCVIKRYALSVNFSCTDNTFAAGNPEQFCYLNQGMSPVVQSIDDAEDFVSVRQALTLLGELELLTPYAPHYCCIIRQWRRSSEICQWLNSSSTDIAAGNTVCPQSGKVMENDHIKLWNFISIYTNY